jgi:hypothetical protein
MLTGIDVENTLRTISEVPLVASLLFLLGALVCLFGGITWWSHRERMKAHETVGANIRSLQASVSMNMTSLKGEFESTRTEWATRDMAALNGQAQFGLIQQELTRAVTGLTTLIDGLLDKFNQREAADKLRDESAARSEKALLAAAQAIPGATASGVRQALDETLRREFEALKLVIAAKIDDDKTHRTQVVETILTRLTELKREVAHMKEGEAHKPVPLAVMPNLGTWNGLSAVPPDTPITDPNDPRAKG